MQLTQLLVHPIKSCKGISYSRAFASQQGLLHDRAWLIATPQGQFITARTHPQLVLLKADLIPGGVILSSPSQAPIIAMTHVYRTAAQVTVWKDQFPAWHGDVRVDQWLSQLLGEPCQLFWLGIHSQRPQKEDPLQTVSFADGYPYLLVNQASLDALNQELDAPVSLNHFRPNFVVNGQVAWQEDQWHRLQIGEVVFDVMGACTRCVLITIDPQTGEKSPDREPLKTLSRLRRRSEGVCFGLNLVVRNEGIVQVGEEVSVLA